MRMGELWHSADDWDYYTVPQAGAAGRRLHLPRGKVLGGSHALNAMIWVRCAPADYDHWAEVGGDGWGWDDVLAVFQAIEDFSGGASPLRGAGGPLPVTDDYPLTPIQASIIDAAVQEGLEHNADYNGDHLDGISQEQVTMKDGRRSNTWTAYLKPVRDRLEIRTGCHVHSVIVEDGRAVGVRYRQDGEDHELRADEVVLSAGAIDSPAILLRSGIGPADELAELGIPLVQDSPDVGRNLHDHLLSPVIFTTTAKPVGPPQSGVSVTQTHLFWKSRPELDVPDTQPINFSVPMFGDTLEPTVSDGFSLMAGIVTPKSRGSLTLSGPGLDDPVQIDLQALADDDDVASLIASVRQCRSIGRQPALAEEWGAQDAGRAQLVAEVVQPHARDRDAELAEAEQVQPVVELPDRRQIGVAVSALHALEALPAVPLTGQVHVLVQVLGAVAVHVPLADQVAARRGGVAGRTVAGHGGDELVGHLRGALDRLGRDVRDRDDRPLSGRGVHERERGALPRDEGEVHEYDVLAHRDGVVRVGRRLLGQQRPARPPGDGVLLERELEDRAVFAPDP